MYETPDNNPLGDILVVDDVVANVKILDTLLLEAGYAVRIATSGKAALTICEKRPPDLVLLDVMMPEVDGYEVCRRLQADEKTQDIPIIFISALNQTDDKLEGFTAGGVDFVTKPFDPPEVLARVKTHIRLVMLQRELQEKNRELKRLATTDPLTGLYNRRSFLERLRDCQKTANRYGTPCSLVMFDLDHFKAINDQHGHNAGDEVLRVTAERTRGILRDVDIAGRWGGEEFMVLAPQTELEGAIQLAERLRESLINDPIEPAGTVTASFGVICDAKCNSLEELTLGVDQALYAAKMAGRNCVRVAPVGED
ncbi:MAG: diguanylate cyclase [Sedimenticola sp.]